MRLSKKSVVASALWWIRPRPDRRSPAIRDRICPAEREPKHAKRQDRNAWSRLPSRRRPRSNRRRNQRRNRPAHRSPPNLRARPTRPTPGDSHGGRLRPMRGQRPPSADEPTEKPDTEKSDTEKSGSRTRREAGPQTQHPSPRRRRRTDTGDGAGSAARMIRGPISDLFRWLRRSAVNRRTGAQNRSGNRSSGFTAIGCWDVGGPSVKRSTSCSMIRSCPVKPGVVLVQMLAQDRTMNASTNVLSLLDVAEHPPLRRAERCRDRPSRAIAAKNSSSLCGSPGSGSAPTPGPSGGARASNTGGRLGPVRDGVRSRSRSVRATATTTPTARAEHQRSRADR